jgi:hypothetical protein
MPTISPRSKHSLMRSIESGRPGGMMRALNSGASSFSTSLAFCVVAEYMTILIA